MSRRDEQREKNRKRWGQVFIGLFFIAIMVLSIVQFANNSTTTNTGLGFNGYAFTQVPLGFNVTAAGKEFTVQDLPLAQNGSVVTFQNLYGTFVPVEAPPGIGRRLRNATYIIVTFDPATDPVALQTIDLSRLDLYQELPNVIGAILLNSTAYPGVPVATCADAKPEVPVILLAAVNDTANNANITVAGDCFSVRGNPQGILAAKDYVLLTYAGVIPDGS